MSEQPIEPVQVHVVADTSGTPRRKTRRAARTNTFTLTAGNAVVPVLPQSDNRLEAWVAVYSVTAVGNLFVSTSQGGAQSQGGGALTIPFTTTAAAAAIEPQWYPLNTTDQVWASATSAAYPVTVSVLAIYEEAD